MCTYDIAITHIQQSDKSLLHGFVRAAISNGAVIIPFASVGLEDSFWVLGRLNAAPMLNFTMKYNSATKLATTLADCAIPILGPYNSLQRQYFAFGRPIDTDKLYGRDWENQAKCIELFSNVRQDVQGMIYTLKQLQQEDPNRCYSLTQYTLVILFMIVMLVSDSTCTS